MNYYRLITPSEMNALALQLEDRLKQWNLRYSLLPIQLQLVREWDEASSYPCRIRSENGSDLALADLMLHDLVKAAAFDATTEDFDKVSQELVLKLIAALTNKPVQEIQTTDDALSSAWKHQGHCALALELTCSSVKTWVLLNPEWVYEQLPKSQKRARPLAPIDEALQKENIDCTVHLSPCVLSLKKLKNLSCGDVLVSDHRLHEPVKLSSHNTPIADVELGQYHDKKSIQIRSIK